MTVRPTPFGEALASFRTPRIEVAEPREGGRATSILNSVHGDHAILAPLEMRGVEFIFLHASCLVDQAWRAIQPGTWVEFTLQRGPKGLRAIEARVVEPSPEARQRKLLVNYRSTHGMAGGTNPGSHRLDGLTSPQAKRMLERGAIDVERDLPNMSENGLRSAAWHYAIDPSRLDRGEIVRRILEAIDSDARKAERPPGSPRN